MREKASVGELCNRAVICATEEMSIKEAANLMRNKHVGSLVVTRPVENGNAIAGMLTDRDIAIVAVARDFDAQSLCVGDVMTSEVTTASDTESLFEVLSKMRNQGVRRLPVTTSDGLLLGIITLDDLLGLLAEEMQVMVHAMQGALGREKRARV